MRATGTAMGGDAVESKEVDLRVCGHHSTAEDFKSAVGKGDAPGAVRSAEWGELGHAEVSFSMKDCL